jgi:hypothetical protein
MFDIFATILSAGVVISVVTLVVHEPLLLAAGISTILGLMFVLLPAFVAMVPMLGYLLIFTGIVLLGYGVISTRSWLNALEAKRVAALARRRTLAAAKNKSDDDSGLRRMPRMSSLAGSGERIGGSRGERSENGTGGAFLPASRSDDPSVSPPLPVRKAATAPVGVSSQGRGASEGGGISGSALGRLGRGVTRETFSPSSDSFASPRSALREARSSDVDIAPKAPPVTVSAVAPIAVPVPVVSSLVAPPAPVLPVSVGLPVPTPAAPPAAKPKSRGAERIEQIKAESRQANQARRRKSAALGKPVATPEKDEDRDERPPENMASPPPPPVVITAATATVATPPSAERRSQMERDLRELGLQNQVRLELPEPGPDKAGSKPFVARLARRS